MYLSSAEIKGVHYHALSKTDELCVCVSLSHLTNIVCIYYSWNAVMKCIYIVGWCNASVELINVQHVLIILQ